MHLKTVERYTRCYRIPQKNELWIKFEQFERFALIFVISFNVSSTFIRYIWKETWRNIESDYKRWSKSFILVLMLFPFFSDCTVNTSQTYCSYIYSKDSTTARIDKFTCFYVPVDANKSFTISIHCLIRKLRWKNEYSTESFSFWFIFFRQNTVSFEVNGTV